MGDALRNEVFTFNRYGCSRSPEYAQWAKFLGGWIEELVFDLEDKAASGAISVRVNSFLLIAPVLRTYLNKSQSALESLNV